MWLFAGNFQEIIARLCAMQWSAKIDNKLYQGWNYLLQNQSIVDWNVSGLIYIWIPSSHISLTSRALNIRPYAWHESFPPEMSRALKWRKYQESKFVVSLLGAIKIASPHPCDASASKPTRISIWGKVCNLNRKERNTAASKDKYFGLRSILWRHNNEGNQSGAANGLFFWACVILNQPFPSHFVFLCIFCGMGGGVWMGSFM